MSASYKIVLTPLAKTAAEKFGSTAVLEAEVRAQIRDLFADEASYANMLFHTFEMAGQEYICVPEKMTEKSSCWWIPAAAETQSRSRRDRSPVTR